MDQMEEIFLHAPPYKEIDMFYSLIKKEPDFLDAIDKKQFVETPLHFSAGAGRTLLALEIQRLMPLFGMKLNADGFSPLHLALQRGHFDTAMAMVRLNPELVGVQGREGITPLHYAAEIDAVDVLAEFLIWSPESIEKLTVREETAAHVAVKCRNLAALKVLVGWMRRKSKRRVLEWKDLEGNTVLHHAASTNQPEVLKVLVYEGRLFKYVNAKNRQDLTALDMVMQLPSHEDNGKALSILHRRRAKTGSSITRTPLAHYLSSKIYILQRMGIIGEYLDKSIPDQMRSAGLVVAGLIVNTTYQGLLRPPSIVNTQNPIALNITSSQADNSSITSPAVGFGFPQAQQALNLSRVDMIMTQVMLAIEFVIPNSIALAAAIGMTLIMLPRKHFFLLHLSLLCLSLSTAVTLGSLYWLQPEMKVGAIIGLIVFGGVFLVCFYMKQVSESRGRMMARGHARYA